MRSRLALTLAGFVTLFVLGGTPPGEPAADKDTLVIALDTLGAQVMDPIADTRAPHAHYHAPLWDSLVGFDLEKGGIGPGVAERWERSADGEELDFLPTQGAALPQRGSRHGPGRQVQPRAHDVARVNRLGGGCPPTGR